MTSNFTGRASSVNGPAGDFFAVTPNDTADLPQVTRALYIGTTGNLTIVAASGAQARFTGVPGGTVLPVRVARVLATGTDAGGLVGLV